MTTLRLIASPSLCSVSWPAWALISLGLCLGAAAFEARGAQEVAPLHEVPGTVNFSGGAAIVERHAPKHSWHLAQSESTAQAGAFVTPPPSPSSQPASWGSPKDKVRFFLSGHSLTDDPLAEHIQAIALSLGGPFAARYNQQIVIGSPIRVRTGMPATDQMYSTGKNRNGKSNLNILRELTTGSTIGGDRYDALVITENHNLLDMLEWENTVRQLRHFHDRMIEANVAGRTYLYSSWWDIDKKQPASWVATERLVAMGWQCVGSRVNRSLQLEGRADRITPLPASLALVELVDRMLNGQLPEIAAPATPDALNRVFTDNVHLTPLGSYYLSLVSYAAIFERSPVGGFRPNGVSAPQAKALQELAWEVVSRFYEGYKEPSLDECHSQWMPQICRAYFGARKAPDRIGPCLDFFKLENAKNPLYFNASSDGRYWFPARP